MASILLIHGAWHGAWCYRKVLPLLTAAGHDARAIDLPGHAGNGRPGWGVGMEDYARAVAGAIAGGGERTHLVGHSMGGLVISRAAEIAPERVASLTYLCAFLPRNGDSLIQLAREDKQSEVVGVSHIRALRGVSEIDLDRAPAVFYGDCAASDIADARRNITPQPLRPFLDKVRLTSARFGATRRHYIACTQDKAISIAQQRRMIERSACSAVVTLETSHSPFYSAPDAVAGAVAGFVANAGAAR